MSAESFIEACAEGNLSAVQDMVKEGLDINIKATSERRLVCSENTGLSVAINTGQDDVALWLLSQEGVDTSVIEDYTYLKFALMNNASVSIITKLLKSFIEACAEGNLSYVQDMVKEGLDINLQDTSENTGLSVAINREQWPVATWLLDCCVMRNYKEQYVVDASVIKKGYTYLHFACMQRAPVSIIVRLLHMMDTELWNAKTDNLGGMTALEIAVAIMPSYGQDKKELTERQGPIIETLGRRLEINWDMDRLQRTDWIEESTLDCSDDMLTLLKSIERERKKLSEMKFAALCKKGPAEEVSIQLSHNPEYLNCLGGAPLRGAALGKNMEVLEVLMGFKELQVNLRDQNDRTALHSATASDSSEIVKKFLEHPNIDVNISSKKGLTPIMEAIRNYNTESLMPLLKDYGVDVNKQDENGKTALHIALIKDWYSLVDKLLNRPDIDVNLPCKEGLTPAMEATKNGKLDSLESLMKDDRIDLDMEDEYGQTLEMIARWDKTGRALRYFKDAREKQAEKNESNSDSD